MHSVGAARELRPIRAHQDQGRRPAEDSQEPLRRRPRQTRRLSLWIPQRPQEALQEPCRVLPPSPVAVHRREQRHGQLHVQDVLARRRCREAPGQGRGQARTACTHQARKQLQWRYTKHKRHRAQPHSANPCPKVIDRCAYPKSHRQALDARCRSQAYPHTRRYTDQSSPDIAVNTSPPATIHRTTSRLVVQQIPLPERRGGVVLPPQDVSLGSGTGGAKMGYQRGAYEQGILDSASVASFRIASTRTRANR